MTQETTSPSLENQTGQKTTRPTGLARLRLTAEELLSKIPGEIQPAPPSYTAELIQELQTHQIELERQNEELRRAQVELEALRARYFDLYDLAPVGYMALNKTGLILEANFTAATLLGVARGALEKQLLSRFIQFEDQDIYYLHRKRLLETGGPRACELRMVKKDETAFWARLEATATQDVHGACLYRVVIRDITDRRKAEETVREQKEFAESLVNTAQTIVLVLDKSGRIVRFNPFMENLSGYKLEEVQGKDWFSTFLPDDDHDRIRELFKMAVEDIDTRGNINSILTKDGRNIFIEWYSKTLRGCDGSVVGVLATGLDVTERKQAEAALRGAHDELEQRVEARTGELKKEIEQRRQTEEALKDRTNQLETQARELHEANTALRVLLRHRDGDKAVFEENVLLTLKHLVFPYLEELEKSRLAENQAALLSIAQSNLKNIVSPFVRKLSSQFLNLTPTEIRVADLVKEGKTNKEIAGVLGASIYTILTHRENLRRKFGLKHKKINLKSYLLSLGE